MRDYQISYSEEFKDGFERDIEDLEKLTYEVLEKCYNLDPLDKNLEIEFSPAENTFVLESMNGVHGLTRNSGKIEFDLSDEPDTWRHFFKSQLAHEYAHTVFMSYEDLEYQSNIENWKHILLEAHDQLFAQKAFPDISPEWRTKFSRREMVEDKRETRY